MTFISAFFVCNHLSVCFYCVYYLFIYTSFWKQCFYKHFHVTASGNYVPTNDV